MVYGTTGPSGHSQPLKKVTAVSLMKQKAAGQRIAACTAYDYHSARLLDAAGVDLILVGDSLGMTVLGYPSTIPVTLDDVVHATAAVTRATTRPFIVADMPFMTYHASYEDGMRNAARLVQEGGAEAVKLEGATELTLRLISGLNAAGVPVVAHLGLTPQSVNVLGGYAVQGKDAHDAAALMLQAQRVADAGACAVVLECIPAELAAAITDSSPIPTIGIGAGPNCDGEVQVIHDLLGYGTFRPRHAGRYFDAETAIGGALAAYVDEVKRGQFPKPENASMAPAGLVHEALQVLESWEGER